MLAILATSEWRAAHPGAMIGLLELSRVENTRPSPQLDDRKRETETRLRERYKGLARQELLALPVMAAYAQYHKRFGKTYHVQLQIESIVLKGKQLPNVSPLVDANFVAEVHTMVLTAGHDVDKLEGALSIDVSRDGDRFTQMSGTPKELLAGDMIMRDTKGICCSILYGQDNRSPISGQTSHVLYVSYAPAGVPAGTVEAQLRAIEENVRLASPQAVREHRHVLVAQ
jgi:DNA/RNA-binding domain of Phe-tRNA-synthetase-like protein